MDACGSPCPHYVSERMSLMRSILNTITLPARKIMTESDFVHALEKEYRAEGYMTKRELGVGYGVADLVLFRPDKANCEKRINHRQIRPLLNEGYFKVFSSLPDIDTEHEPMDLKKLSEITHYSTSFLKYTLIPDLKKGRYVKEFKGDYYMKVNGWLPIGDELVAIEAKLHDWKRGFYQANRYRAFADRTYLAVPRNVAARVDISLLEMHGVGLIAFDAVEGEKEIMLESVRRQPVSDTKRNLASEFFWTAPLRASMRLS